MEVRRIQDVYAKSCRRREEGVPEANGGKQREGETAGGRNSLGLKKKTGISGLENTSELDESNGTVRFRRLVILDDCRR